MRWLDWLLGRHDLGFVKDWSPERAVKLEREMYTRLGRVTEPSYDWHAKWKADQRARVERKNLRQFQKRA